MKEYPEFIKKKIKEFMDRGATRNVAIIEAITEYVNKYKKEKRDERRRKSGND